MYSSGFKSIFYQFCHPQISFRVFQLKLYFDSAKIYSLFLHIFLLTKIILCNISLLSNNVGGLYEVNKEKVSNYPCGIFFIL